ncbi:hypothetical protein CFIMG_008164RA00001 [Ceratocystis fimbriata CBS 114723]|uniref:Arrestin-like N-terminal domain-containing protein n=1 Tax=Ceratocystis fimbriata CBS 114723 TaxID=1035309 RepID=A0A2C5X620_9PEZI|nr:hypothetical protein CFIMG_008164RA00001 [Ceratocystis fimbriata CBS 114723]
MSARIILDNPPEFYTNLDTISGRIQLILNRAELVGAVIAKLEGEAITSFGPASQQVDKYGHYAESRRSSSGGIPIETHKILYKVQQAFPPNDPMTGTSPGSVMLNRGMHEFPFQFRLPFNNACSDSAAMASLGGLAGVGGFGSGLRVMDGSKQLFLRHVLKTLPPSLNGLSSAAEVRYYVKVTVQRPGLLKENWRSLVGFRFMPMEQPRKPPASSMMYARRPFVFSQRPNNPANAKKKKSKTTIAGDASQADLELDLANTQQPTIEISALLPHPAILTCNKPVPLRIVATKKTQFTEPVYLVAFELVLLGLTHIRCHDFKMTDPHRWVVCATSGLSIPVTTNPNAEVGTEFVLPDNLWKHIPLPNTVHPAFVTCNISRTYELEVRLGLSRDKPGTPESSSTGSTFTSIFRNSGIKEQDQLKIPADTIFLPLRFNNIDVYSGIAPPPQLLSEIQRRQSQMQRPPPHPTHPVGAVFASPAHNYGGMPGGWPGAGRGGPMFASPPLPPRRPNQGQAVDPRIAMAAASHDPLYPPQMGTPAAATFEEAPPSYEEALADAVAGPFENNSSRPAYSGTTDVNASNQATEANGKRAGSE